MRRLRIGAALALLHCVGLVIRADVQTLLILLQLLRIHVAARLDRIAVAAPPRRARGLATRTLPHGALLIRLGSLRFLGHRVSVGDSSDCSKPYALPMPARPS